MAEYFCIYTTRDWSYGNFRDIPHASTVSFRRMVKWAEESCCWSIAEFREFLGISTDREIDENLDIKKVSEAIRSGGTFEIFPMNEENAEKFLTVAKEHFVSPNAREIVKIWRFRCDLINVIILQGDKEAKEFVMADASSMQLFVQATLSLTDNNRKIIKAWLKRLEEQDIARDMFVPQALID